MSVGSIVFGLILNPANLPPRYAYFRLRRSIFSCHLQISHDRKIKRGYSIPPKLVFVVKLSIIFAFFLRYTKAIKDKVREKRWKKDSSDRQVYMCQMFV